MQFGLSKLKVFLFVLLSIALLILLSEGGYYLYQIRIKPKTEEEVNIEDFSLTQNEQTIYDQCGRGENIGMRGFLIKASFLNFLPDESKFEVFCQQKIALSFNDKTSFKILNENTEIMVENVASEHPEAQTVTAESFFNNLKEGDELQINISEMGGIFTARSVVKS